MSLGMCFKVSKAHIRPFASRLEYKALSHVATRWVSGHRVIGHPQDTALRVGKHNLGHRTQPELTVGGVSPGLWACKKARVIWFSSSWASVQVPLEAPEELRTEWGPAGLDLAWGRRGGFRLVPQG